MVVKVVTKENKSLHEKEVDRCYTEDSILHIVKSTGTIEIPLSDVVSCITNQGSRQCLC